MRSLMPEKLLEEQDRLYPEYMDSTEDCTILEYILKHGSEEMRNYLENEIKEKKEARARGVILN